jgi:hypothetical protein
VRPGGFQANCARGTGAFDASANFSPAVSDAIARGRLGARPGGADRKPLARYGAIWGRARSRLAPPNCTNRSLTCDLPQ